MRESLRPIEAGCAAMWFRTAPVRDCTPGVVTVVGPYETFGVCSVCGGNDFWLHDGGGGRQIVSCAQCALVRIDPDDDQRARWEAEDIASRAPSFTVEELEAAVRRKMRRENASESAQERERC